MTLSIIIPVYNCREYLKSCVESVLKVNSCCEKTFIRELILVDDGSTDGSFELCDELAEKLSTETCVIRPVHQQNSGVSAARNEGLKAATGTHILFVDSDDTVDAGMMTELLNIIDADDSIDMAVYGMAFDYYSGTKLYRQDIFLPHDEGRKSTEECASMLYELFKKNSLSSLCNRIIKRSIVAKNSILLRDDMFLYEDLEFSLRVLAHCSNIYFYQKPIYHYRQSGDEGNVGRRLGRIAHITELIDKIERALDSFEQYKKDILLSLYLTLAREKIYVSSKNEIDVICTDFKSWIDKNELLSKISDKEYAMLIYEGKAGKLINKRRYTKIRHSVANWIKQSFGDFRKW